jgi:hypothetical protein
MASRSSKGADEADDRPAIVQELGFTVAEIEALLDGVLARQGCSFAKERALPQRLSYRVHSPSDRGSMLLHFEPLPDRTFAGGRMRFPRTRLTGIFLDASANVIEAWQRRLQQTFLKGGG